MSDSWIAFQPAIDDPSNMMPSVNVSSSTIERSQGDVLPFAARIGKTEIDVFDFVVLDHFRTFFGVMAGVPIGAVNLAFVTKRWCPRDSGRVRWRQPLFRRCGSGWPLRVRDENLAVADPPGPGGAPDRLDRSFDLLVTKHNLDFHLGEKVNDIFGAAVELGVSLLPPKPLGLGDRYPWNATSCNASFTSSNLNGLMIASIFFIASRLPAPRRQTRHWDRASG